MSNTKLTNCMLLCVSVMAVLLASCGGGGGGSSLSPTNSTLTAELSVERQYIITGSSTNLIWTSNADHCSISNNVLNNGPATGSINVNPTVITTYMLTCESGGSAAQDQITITVDNDVDGDYYPDVLEFIVGTDPSDADSDDDGILDGNEDSNANGLLDTDETDPLNPATRNNFYCDGVRIDNEDDGYDIASGCLNPEHLSLGGAHACIYTDKDQLRCWGRNDNHQLGFLSSSIGDDELPVTSDLVSTSGRIIQVSSGGFHTCVLYDSGSVHCWGSGEYGKTGQLSTGDRSALSSNIVDVGGDVIQISAGPNHTCAVLDNFNVRCWGNGTFGALGYGNTEDIGDDETPASAGDVSLNGEFKQVGTGVGYSCALTRYGDVKCWGSAYHGKLGYGNNLIIGDNETPSSLGFVNLGQGASQIAVGNFHACALKMDNTVTCWGSGTNGQLGYGNTEHIGDDETPAGADVSLSGPAQQITAGSDQTCALLMDGSVQCWGRGPDGALGYGSSESIGDDELVSSAGTLNLDGKRAIYIEAGNEFTCAYMEDRSIYCWGDNNFGQLGYGHTDDIGDDIGEYAASEGPVSYQ
jgi:alpha-tubulin suppressor-like RCC1 family protein